jgi:RNA polymerase sigma-70 factor (ECF subfamily)
LHGVFQRAFTNLQKFREDSTFLTWMTGIAINEALMMLRRRPKNMILPQSAAKEDKGTEPVEVADLRPTPEQAFAEHEIRVAMMHSISLLRPSLRSVVLLCELQGRTNVETARRLGLSLSAVKSRRFHARRNLCSPFKEHYSM